ncbi:GH92 family glycosyl hydrolase [Confluentibacter sediminis]|uniref:GH92 family glycosyl hydrolase n=1 Tax=Confluentibacter sediminis TaxID=2219045 RepID=UPI000DAF3D80|nr:GH92 family glycosyl hydrolase [Confluentibacter sediminis]
MNRKQFTLITFILLVQLYAVAQVQSGKTENSKYVNPIIGTGSIDSLSLSGSNFPGAVVPFGFVQLSPDTEDSPDDPCSGYDYADNKIVGFSHTHLSGTGVADLFDFLFMPFRGEQKWNANDEGDQQGYSSLFSHENEIASPGYYSVFLNDPQIKVEVSATEHCGVHKYTSETDEPFSIIIDLNHSLDKKRPYWSCKIIDAQIRIIDDYTIEGYRSITGWANLRKVYFRAEFSRPFITSVIKAGSRIYTDEKIANHQNLKTIIGFDKNKKPLVVRVGLSSVSYEGAKNNLHAEIQDFNFNDVKTEAKKQWDKELSVIDIEGSEDQKEIFYTSLYHTFIHPNNIADVNGDYINSNGELKNTPDKKYYSTFSLWDTYRAAHPLFTITQEKRSADFINSMLRYYNDYGCLPIWQLWGKETYCMIGNHAIPVIVDAYNKKIPNIDYDLAYKAIKASSSISHQNSAFNVLEKYGYFPENIETQSVSITLEIAYDDWCVAHMAKGLGFKKDFEHFIKRSEDYKNLFDSSIGFFRAKNSDGNWIEPFSPLKYGGNGGYSFTEGNAWQYLWYVPHDIYVFEQMFGGEKQFTAKLDTFFTLEAKSDDVNGNASGFIGQYAHGNEPSHHIAYLYNYTNTPWKSQFYTNKIINDLYSTEPSGYSGNEDCGQMSAWYIFSAMGFYPVNPANNVYSFGSPQLKNVRINLSNGKTFEVLTHNRGNKNIYIQKIILNGKRYRKNFIIHKDIVLGGKIEFFMGPKPNKDMANYEKPPIILK